MTAARKALDRFVHGVDGEALGAHGVHVLVGDDAAEHRWRADDREDIHSAAKGVCALAVGMAVDEGLVSIDEPVATYLPGFALGDGVAEVTLRHLLTMTSGIDLPWTPDELDAWTDLAAEMLRRPSRGRVFQYANASTYTAMRALGALVGDVCDWLTPRLFAPLGIRDVRWRRCPRGWIAGGDGLELRTRELARIGRLLRDRGAWEGEQLVSASWVDGMHRGGVDAGGQGIYARYGMSTWSGPGDAWRLHGAYGQFVIVDQAHDAVITITAHEETRGDRMAELAHAALRG
ncbi:serine hydrolase [Microbacterium betulae]|uniref:Serine hydrolase n=1 Tax=Microbacterium betulae TaxID=2981139 RepID=A0AA97I7V4_9MICO|nr:serine hydrolase domain-containing protein [Microbacterium sp. AB]WOF24672.1 serine hydrolase [Microbacterium sp. AB]